MKFSDLRPCDACRGPIGLTFRRVTVEHHVVDTREAQRALAMEAYLGGNSMLASVFDTAGDRATLSLNTDTILLCEQCYCLGRVAQAVERRTEAGEAEPSR